MGRNLIGYFGGMPDCKQYTAKIISDSTNNSFDEFEFAAGSPFVVTYDTSNTPFDPIRGSRASISVLASEYFFDVYSPEAQGTKVTLEDESGNTLWFGWLTNNLLNQNQDGCDNIFTIEAQDSLYILDKLDYELKGEKKAIVTFEDILAQIATKCGVDNLYIDLSLNRPNGGQYISMRDLTISEQNFFSSDSDEPWTLKQVLEELCRYLGYTAVIYKKDLNLFDMQMHTSQTFPDSNRPVGLIMNCYEYTSADGFHSYRQGSLNYGAYGYTLNERMFMDAGADISLETLYNKVQVKDSFYEVDHFIPDMWEDNLLTNRQGDFWKCNQIAYSGKFRFMNKNGREKAEEKDENEHIYYLRKFDHEDYESIYRDQNTLSTGVTPALNGILISSVETDSYSVNYTPIQYQGEDFYRGTYTVTATFVNTTSGQKTVHIYGNLRYDYWDADEGIMDYSEDDNGGSPEDLVLAKAGSTNSAKTITITRQTDYPAKYQCSVSYGAWYRIGSASQTYPITEGINDDSKKYVGGTIVDLATFERPMDNSKYLYETEANINFDRYLMIRQANKPDRQHPYSNWLFEDDMVPLHDNQIDAVYPCIFRLKAGYTNPVIYDEKAYLAIDANAIFTRYDVEYINPDWTDENTNMNGLGLFRKMASITTITPALIFLLKVGDKYWSSETNSWTTTKSCFVVKLGTDKTDEDNVDFTGWWGEDHPVLNNISWTDWAGVKGYKIPLEVGMDMNQPIEFEVHMPSKMQVFKTTGDSGSGINSMCWIKDFKMEFATKGSENYSNSDVLYENIIDENSVNTLSDITCKITTYAGEGMHSYSNVALDGVLLEKMVRSGLDGVANNPEENIIKAYTNQYSSNTIKQNLTLGIDITPFSRIKDPTLDGKYFGVLGATIDYAKGTQRLTLIETKPWSITD